MANPLSRTLALDQSSSSSIGDTRSRGLLFCELAAGQYFESTVAEGDDAAIVLLRWTLSWFMRRKARRRSSAGRGPPYTVTWPLTKILFYTSYNRLVLDWGSRVLMIEWFLAVSILELQP